MEQNIDSYVEYFSAYSSWTAHKANMTVEIFQIILYSN